LRSIREGEERAPRNKSSSEERESEESGGSVGRGEGVTVDHRSQKKSSKRGTGKTRD